MVGFGSPTFSVHNFAYDTFVDFSANIMEFGHIPMQKILDTLHEILVIDIISVGVILFGQFPFLYSTISPAMEYVSTAVEVAL